MNRPDLAHSQVLPNAMLIGVQKAGTSALYDWLAQHPDIYAPAGAKDFHFFASDSHYQKGTDHYASFYPACKGQRIILGGGVNHIYFDHSAKRIFEFNPKIKLIVVLRNPVSRAWSAYNYFKKLGIETLSFEEALRGETHREKSGFAIRADQTYIDHGRYSRQLKNYLSVFKREQILVLLYEELMASKQEKLNEIYNFLGLEKGFVPLMTGKNKTGRARFKTLNKFLYSGGKLKRMLRNLMPLDLFVPLSKRMALKNRIRDWNTTGSVSDPLPAALKSHLENIFSEEISELELLLGRDLSVWKEGEKQSSAR
jgi:hypothetical protein